MKNIEKPKRCKFLKYTRIIQWNGTSENKHSNNANRTRILVPLFTLNPPFLFPRGRASSNTFCLRVFTLSLPPCLSSREPTHFTVPDLRLATRATTEPGNYRGSDYLANRREIIARDASEGATFRAKIPLRGRSFLSNIVLDFSPNHERLDLIQVEISISNENRIIILTILKVKLSFFI